MSLTFNLTGGKEIPPDNTKAFLYVAVPNNSVVTATKGNITLTPMMWNYFLRPTEDCAIFLISSNTFDNNAWTITATFDGLVATDSIIINSANKFNVDLANQWLIQDGKFSKIYVDRGNRLMETTESDDGYVSFTSNKINASYCTLFFEGLDLSKYKSLIFDGSATGYYNETGYCPAVGVIDTLNYRSGTSSFFTYEFINTASSASYSDRAIKIIPIDSNGSVSTMVGFQMGGSTSYAGGIQCWNMYLSYGEQP